MSPNYTRALSWRGILYFPRCWRPGVVLSGIRSREDDTPARQANCRRCVFFHHESRTPLLQRVAAWAWHPPQPPPRRSLPASGPEACGSRPPGHSSFTSCRAWKVDMSSPLLIRTGSKHAECFVLSFQHRGGSPSLQVPEDSSQERSPRTGVSGWCGRCSGRQVERPGVTGARAPGKL